LVLGGAAVAVVGIVYWMGARPVAGDLIASYEAPEVGDGGLIVVRSERGGDRAFVELHRASPSEDAVIWQALIPRYAGDSHRRALAWSHDALTVRVERGDSAEVFALAMHDGSKLGGFRLAIGHQPFHVEATGPITLTDHLRSYEIVGAAGWHQLIAVDLETGKGLWEVDLGADHVDDGGCDNGVVWLRQNGHKRTFDGPTGRELSERS
jgi:outer membrane protein assembly factor BamB